MKPNKQPSKPKTSSRPFPESEYERRLASVRRTMQERRVDGLLVSRPENIFYLSGLDYQGYFAYQLLVVPLEGAPVLITRAMERAIIRDKVPDVRHVGYSDGITPIPPPKAEDVDLVYTGHRPQDQIDGLRPWSTSLGIPTRESETPPSPSVSPARATCDVLAECGLAKARLGIEKDSPLLPFGIAEEIIHCLPNASFEDASDLVNDCRLVQSPLELACTRKAAAISESMILAAIAAAGSRIHKRDILAAIYQTMVSRGGSYPSFAPLVRSTRTLEHEHGPWEDGRLAKRDVLFLELSGCVERYHAPASRLIFIGSAPARADGIRRICEEAIECAQRAMRPGALAGEVYEAWQQRVNDAGMHGYSRHHCGYAVGIGFPPAWTASGVPVGLRSGSTMELQAGMVFHLMSWLLGTGRGDYVISDTVAVTETGCEVLTNVSRGLHVR